MALEVIKKIYQITLTDRRMIIEFARHVRSGLVNDILKIR